METLRLKLLYEKEQRHKQREEREKNKLQEEFTKSELKMHYEELKYRVVFKYSAFVFTVIAQLSYYYVMKGELNAGSPTPHERFIFTMTIPTFFVQNVMFFIIGLLYWIEYCKKRKSFTIQNVTWYILMVCTFFEIVSLLIIVTIASWLQKFDNAGRFAYIGLLTAALEDVSSIVFDICGLLKFTDKREGGRKNRLHFQTDRRIYKTEGK